MWLFIQICLALLALVVIGITNWVYKWRNPPNSFNGMRLPPGSMGLPLIGETIQFITPSKSFDMPLFLKKRIKKYGTLFKTSFMGHPIIVSVDPEVNRYILLQEGKFVELWYLDTFSKLMGHDDNIDDSEIKTNVYGQIHKHIRNLLLNYIGNETLKQKLLFQLHTFVDESLNAWTFKESVDLKHDSAKMIFAFIAKLMFNYDIRSSEDLKKDVLNLVSGSMSWPINIPGTNYHSGLKSRTKLFKIIEEIVKERVQSPETRKGDLVDQLVHYMETDNLITEQFIVNALIVLLFTAVESVSTPLTMSVKFISENLEVVQQLQKEFKEIHRNTEDKAAGLKWEDYKSMTYTAQVINEILRFSSPAPGLLRRAIKDIHLNNGYIIPKGWIILISQPGLHLNPDIYEDCLAFKPSRWKDRSASDSLWQHYIPFGGGGRPCAGAAFTKALMASFLHLLVTKYRWTKHKEGKVMRVPSLKIDGGYHIKISKKNP